MPKISIIEPLSVPEDVIRAKLQDITDQGHDIVISNVRTTAPKELIERAAGAEIVVVGNVPVGVDVVSQLPDLKFLNVAFTGVNHIAVDQCKAQGVAVSNASGYATDAVAELTLGMALNLSRKMQQCDAAVRAGRTKEGLVGWLLKGRRWGVVGTGAIGQRTAELARAMGCTVVGHSRSGSCTDIPQIPLAELCATCDIISLHVPLTADTERLIGEVELGLMQPHTLLINVARGPVVDTPALVRALHEGRLGGAGVDVFDVEPPIATHPLYICENTLLTPHVAFASDQSFSERVDIVGDNIRAFLRGEQINTIV